jgi:hypothetical protein
MKKSKNGRNHGFSYYLCLMEGSGAGSVLVTNDQGNDRNQGFLFTIFA